jgi:putative toxin-antitoxin system antitoxin component (TIGR02293 family)
MSEDKSWLESCWEEDLKANKDNPNPYVQYVANSFRRVLRLGKLTDRAHEVFGNPKRAAEWLTSPQFALGGNTPFEYADTEPGGAQVVEHLLGRLAHPSNPGATMDGHPPSLPAA